MRGARVRSQQRPGVAIPLIDNGGRELVEFLASGARPAAEWTIGTEHEKFGFRLDDLRPPTLEGERGIEAMLKGMTRSAGRRWRSTTR